MLPCPSCNCLSSPLLQDTHACCRGFITWPAFRVGPKWKILRPFLADGLSVSVRTLTVIGVIMTSTGVLARISAVSQAAHEILRNLWIFLFQFVEGINISNQSIVATALGAKEYDYAFEVCVFVLPLYACAILLALTGTLLHMCVFAISVCVV